MKLPLVDLKEFSAVITAGGIGTRLLPYSKEIPKEMSPILVRDNGNVIVKPIIQAIFEQLHDAGIRDFFTVVGRGKRAIEDHFTLDQGFLDTLNAKGKKAYGLVSFYEKLRSSNLVFVMQPEPLGFGDAVLRVRPYVKEEFLVYAGDTYILSEGLSYLERLKSSHYNYEADVTILLQEVKNPWDYGIIRGRELAEGIMEITDAVEKPDNFIGDTAIMPVYIFNQTIFQTLSEIVPGKGGEIQLTDAIRKLISKDGKVLGVKLGEKEVRLDIGSPETLIDALWTSRGMIQGRETIDRPHHSERR